MDMQLLCFALGLGLVAGLLTRKKTGGYLVAGSSLATMAAVMIASLLRADDGGDAGAAVAQVTDVLAAYTPGQLAHLGLAAVAGGLLAPAGQNVLEHVFALVPKLPAAAKACGPTVLGLAGTYAAQRYLGLSPAESKAAFVAFVGLTHLFNQSPLAAVAAPAVATGAVPPAPLMSMPAGMGTPPEPAGEAGPLLSHTCANCGASWNNGGGAQDVLVCPNCGVAAPAVHP